MTDTTEQFDLVVLGGGPAGSSVATFVAMQGHRVLLLEREVFPRHQLGESLLPATVHGICPLLGVKEEIDRAGFPRKRGGTFRWGKNPEPWTFTFSSDPDGPRGYAYQVERAKFDKILLDNAKKKGVDVREQHTVREVITETVDGAPRVVGARFLDAAGNERTVRARFVVDSEGHRSHNYHLVGKREYSKFFQNVALYTYFTGGKRLPSPNQGNILSAAFGEGWFWYIPLSDTLTSVGAVISRDAADKMKDGHEAAFNSYVDACPIIKEYLSPATRVTDGMYGEFRIRKDYSYSNTKFHMPGMVLIGDAACFIDPVFSSGVHLATYSGLLAARSVNTCLRDPAADETACFDEFEFRYRREFANFYQFLVAFYDMEQSEDSYFWEARKVLNTEERGNQAFVRLVAGLSSSEEPAFGGAEDFFDDRRGLGTWFQGVVEEHNNKAAFKRAVAKPASAKPMDGSRFDADQFMRGFASEIYQVQVQAALGAERPAEKIMRAGGLIPSVDGFHWQPANRPASR